MSLLFCDSAVGFSFGFLLFSLGRGFMLSDFLRSSIFCFQVLYFWMSWLSFFGFDFARLVFSLGSSFRL